jgi:lipoprotein NlpD
MGKRVFRSAGLIALAALVFLAACSSSSVLAPVGRHKKPDRKPANQHLVAKGETLYSIAWRYGLDYRDVAAFNGIAPPYTIFPGQRLAVVKPSYTSARVRSKPRSPEARPAKPRAARQHQPRKDTRATKGAARKPRAASKANPGWLWPAKGKVITTFGQSGKKGVDIAGRVGQTVQAAAGGRVVYSGSGLRGSGKLIIIKHNKHYLSAYAHSNKMLVSEGDQVASGQRIAEMGKTEADRVMLHFEIRRDGKPVDPLRYLPK